MHIAEQQHLNKLVVCIYKLSARKITFWDENFQSQGPHPQEKYTHIQQQHPDEETFGKPPMAQNKVLHIKKFYAFMTHYVKWIVLYKTVLEKIQ